MSAKVGRSIRVEITSTVGKIVVESPPRSGEWSLRIQADIKKSLDWKENRARVQIYNLSQRTRDRISGVIRPKDTLTSNDRLLLRSGLAEPDVGLGIASVAIFAGYGDDVQKVFSGDCQRIEHKRDGNTTMVTTLDTGSAEARLKLAKINKSYNIGTNRIQVVKDLLREVGATMSRADEFVLDGAFSRREELREDVTHFSRGFTAVGPAAVFLDELLTHYFEVQWSIQDNELVILTEDQTLTQSPVELGSRTGLVGSPERLEGGKVRALALMDTRIRPGARVLLDSREIRGEYKVSEMDMSLSSDATGDHMVQMEMDSLAGFL